MGGLGTPPAALATEALRVEIAPGARLSTRPLTLAAGETLGVLGVNGAGKTSLLRTLAGELSPAEGRIWLRGRDVTTLDPSERARAGLRFLPQAEHTFPSLTIAENLSLAAASAEARRRTEQQLVAAMPGCALSTRAQLLSGGERQVLAVFMTFSAPAAVYLLDEPYAGLDASRVQALRGAIREALQAQSAAAIIIDHDAERLRADARRTLDMQDIAAFNLT